jgi:glycosyltransferase involved in cell wall biosynthesis
MQNGKYGNEMKDLANEMKDLHEKALQRIDALLKKNKPQEALTLLKKLDNIRPITLNRIHANVKTLSALGQHREALDMLLRLTESSYPTFPDRKTLQLQVMLYTKLGNALWADYARCMLSETNRHDILQQTIDKSLYDFAEGLIITGHHAAAMIVLLLATEDDNIEYITSSLYKTIVTRWPSLGTVCELFAKKQHPVTLVVDTVDDISLCTILADLLTASGRNVHLLLPPVKEEYNGQDINNITDITFQNIEIEENLRIYYPIALYENDEMKMNNVAHIVDRIRWAVNFTLVVAEMETLDILLTAASLKRKGQRFTPNFCTGFPSAAVAYVGSYLTFNEYMHGKELMTRPILPGKGRVGISVVIPTRDAHYTLEHTLRTCLNQRIDNYEILICDNSTPGNTKTYELVKALNNKKIRYVRTPRELSQTKNFEHAILQAEGDFIFTIGSDDAILFHGLEYIENALKELPDEDIIQWDRVLYAWPGFNVASGQEGQFDVPRLTNKNFTITKYETANLMDKILENPKLMYSMPLLYLNSGFRRSYLQKLYDKTGRILGATPHDIYAGVVNMATNKTIPLIPVPLIIAGMSPASIFMRLDKNSIEAKKNDVDYMPHSSAVRVPSAAEERALLLTPTDVDCFLGMYLCVADMGLNLNYNMDKISWDKMYAEMLQQLKNHVSRFDIFDISMRQLTHSAYKVGQKFGRNFEENLLPSAYKFYQMADMTSFRRSYIKGFTDTNSLTLDAADFGVTNVYEACELFEKIFNL